MLIAAILILSACSKPFFIGKKHQLRWKIPQKVYVIDTLMDERGYISVLFVLRKDTITRDSLTPKEFSKTFRRRP